jgi:hypothetical protein
MKLILQDMFQNACKHEFQSQPPPSTSGTYISADLPPSPDDPDDITSDYKI